MLVKFSIKRRTVRPASGSEEWKLLLNNDYYTNFITVWVKSWEFREDFCRIYQWSEHQTQNNASGSWDHKTTLTCLLYIHLFYKMRIYGKCSGVCLEKREPCVRSQENVFHFILYSFGESRQKIHCTRNQSEDLFFKAWWIWIPSEQNDGTFQSTALRVSSEQVWWWSSLTWRLCVLSGKWSPLYLCSSRIL